MSTTGPGEPGKKQKAKEAAIAWFMSTTASPVLSDMIDSIIDALPDDPEPTPASMLDEIIKIKVNEVAKMREEILTAFVAKHGFQPEEAVQVSNGMHWWVEKKQPKPGPSKPREWWVAFPSTEGFTNANCRVRSYPPHSADVQGCFFVHVREVVE